MPATSTKRYKLADGRHLSYHEYGADDGLPVIYCHGFPGSHLEVQLVSDVAKQQGIRIIAIDRPGYGDSDFHAGRVISDWPADVAALADALGIKGFAMLAASGGAPYALACAYQLPARVSKLGIIAGVGPVAALSQGVRLRHSLQFSRYLAHYTPLLLRAVFILLGMSFRYCPSLALAWFTRNCVVADKQVLRQEKVRRILLESLRTAVFRGSRGMWWDFMLYVQDWGFPLEEVKVPVYWWHGLSDRVVPPSMGEYTASHLANCQFTPVSGEGHYSLPVEHTIELLAQLFEPGESASRR